MDDKQRDVELEPPRRGLPALTEDELLAGYGLRLAELRPDPAVEALRRPTRRACPCHGEEHEAAPWG